MLAYINIALLSFWLIAEVVPLLADNLASIENQITSNKVSKKDD